MLVPDVNLEVRAKFSSPFSGTFFQLVVPLDGAKQFTSFRPLSRGLSFNYRWTVRNNSPPQGFRPLSRGLSFNNKPHFLIPI